MDSLGIQPELDPLALGRRARRVQPGDDLRRLVVPRADLRTRVGSELLELLRARDHPPRCRSRRRAPIPSTRAARPRPRTSALDGLRRAKHPRSARGGSRPSGSSREWDSIARRIASESSISANGSFAVPPSISTVMKFIAGEPMKPATNRLTGLVVELLRAADLLQLALPHHRDPIAERHRLGLVVGDVDGRRLEPVLDPRDLGPHLHAQLRVEVRERLVHQEGLRLAHDRAAHRDPLALAAGEVRRLAVEVLGEVEDLGRASRPSR